MGNSPGKKPYSGGHPHSWPRASLKAMTLIPRAADLYVAPKGSEMNLGRLLKNSAERYPDRVAIVSGGGRWTYQEFDARTDYLAAAMLKAGLEKGDRVALLFFNGIHFAETYFAVAKAGLVATPINFRLVAREMAYQVEDCQARAFFYGSDFEETVEGIRGELDTVRLLVSPKGSSPSPAKEYEDFLTGAGRLGSLPHLTEEDPCQIIYTSGTTGKPKGAVITHGNLAWNIVNTVYGRQDRPGDRALIIGPLFHTAALNNHFSLQVAIGGTSILIRKFEPESLLATIERERATLMSGSPAIYNMLMQHPAADKYDRRSILRVTAGGDKLPTETKKRIVEFFPNIEGVVDLYGCTEASPTIAVINARDSMRKDGSVGPAPPFMHARIVGEDDHSLAPGEVGEVVCRGPNVMKGYHDNPEASAEALRNGWLHTGDLGRTDEEGFFYIVDRKKDMIVSGGENIYPREVEDVLYSHPEIVDAAVVGAPDPLWNECVFAYIVKRSGSELDAQGVTDFCKARMASYKKPKHVLFVRELPRSLAGKVLKRDLRERAAQERSRV
jgi:fatty-acyl-CoA synthase